MDPISYDERVARFRPAEYGSLMGIMTLMLGGHGGTDDPLQIAYTLIVRVL